MCRSPLSFVFILLANLFFLTHAQAEQKPLGKVTLKPGEEKTYTISSTTPVKVGFSTDLEIAQMQSCKHSGIQLSAPELGEMTMASPLGTSIEVPAKNGQVTFMLKNMEAFPIPVQAERD